MDSSSFLCVCRFVHTKLLDFWSVGDNEMITAGSQACHAVIRVGIAKCIIVSHYQFQIIRRSERRYNEGSNG